MNLCILSPENPPENLEIILAGMMITIKVTLPTHCHLTNYTGNIVMLKTYVVSSLLFILCISFIATIKSAEADDIPPAYYKLLTNFNDEFPPAGWTIQTKTMEKLWNRKNYENNGYIFDDYYALVSHHDKYSFDEYLITDKVYLNNDYLYDKINLYPFICFELTYQQYVDFSQYDFVLEVSFDKINWVKIFSLGNINKLETRRGTYSLPFSEGIYGETYMDCIPLLWKKLWFRDYLRQCLHYN